MRSRFRQFILGSAILITLTVPAGGGMQSDAELLTRMQQEVQKLEQQVQTANSQCQAGNRQACELRSERQRQLERMQRLIEGCQKDERESCTQLRSLRRR
jgi:TolA-binding protein